MMRSFGRALVVVGGLLAAAGTAWGFSAAELKCQQAAGPAGLNLFRSTLSALKACEDLISRGALAPSTDCTTETKTAARIARAEALLAIRLKFPCTDAVVASLAAGGGLAGDCAGATSLVSLNTCLKQSHEAAAIELTNLPYHAPAALTRGQQRCQQALAGKALTLATARLTKMQACMRSIAKGTLPPGSNCLLQMSGKVTLGAKLATDTARSATSVDKSCCGTLTITRACTYDALTGFTLGAPCGGVGNGASAGACAFCEYANTADKLLLTEYGTLPTGGGPAAKAMAAQITDPGTQCVLGPLSRCRLNDYILKNDRIRVVIQDVQRNLFGIGQFGGQIIDADLVRAPSDPDRDNFEEWSTSVNIENTAHYTSVVVLNDGTDGNPAVIRATGPDDLLDFLNPSSTVAGLGFVFPASADDRDLPMDIVTDYILEPGKNYVRVETTLTNTGAAPLNIFFGEFLNGSGQVQLFQPVVGFGEPLATFPCPSGAINKCDFVAYAGRDAAAGVSYGYVNLIPGSTTFTTSGVTVPQLGVSILFALLGISPPPFDIAAAGTAGDSLTFTRYFVVGNGTVSSVTDARNELECVATGTLTGTVTAGGAPMAGIDVAVLGPADPSQIPSFPANIAKNVVTHTQTDASGKYSLTLPPGNFNVMANLSGYPFEGGGATPVQHPVTIQLYSTTTQDMALPATGALHVTLTDEASNPIPGKVSVVGFDPSPDPLNTNTAFGLGTIVTGVFGERIGGSPPVPIDGLPFGITKVIFLGEDGDSGTVPLEPGNYRVVVSRGPEYSIATQDITITAGSTTTVNAQIARVLNSAGLVASDFHVHCIESPDSKVARTERVRTMRAEGVDFFTPSDHDFRSDFNPTIASMGLTGEICTATSAEITTFDYGHFNAWPMSIDTSKVNGGSVDWGIAGGTAPPGVGFPSNGYYVQTPGQIFSAAHSGSVDGQSTVQVNHMYSHFGLQSGNGLAIDTGLTPPQSASSAIMGPAKRLNPTVLNYFDSGFDALEVWIGDDRSQVYNNMYDEQDPSIPVTKVRGGTLGDWFNMLNQGIRRTAVADSDTHRQSLTQAGTPRTLVAADSDEPCLAPNLQAEADALSASVNAGRTIGTNAPIVRVTAHATSTGASGALERRCVGVSACTGTASCAPCSDEFTCGSGTCTQLPTLISTTDGSVDITVDVQSPLWAEFDTMEFYVNPSTKQFTIKNEQTGAGLIDVNHYGVIPTYVKHAGTDFIISTVNDFPAISGAEHLEASYTLSLTGLTQDEWVVVIVRGTDGVSKPLFPVIPNDLKRSTNTTLANLIDGNLGEDGVTALAFTNPLFIDADGVSGWTAPGVNFCEGTGQDCTTGSECCSTTCTSGACT